jgi:hypothetical protein
MVKKENRKKKKNYIGKYPVNSRITIDYSSGKPKVKFGYPRKDVKRQVILSSATFLPALLVCLILLIIFSSNYHLSDARGEPELNDCISYSLYINGSTKFVGQHVECIIDGEIYDMYTKYEPGKKLLWIKQPPSLVSNPDTSDVNIEMVLAIMNSFIFMFIFIGVMIIFYFFYTSTNLGRRIFPEMNKKLADARYYTKIKNLNSKTFELPLFKNMYLDYKAKGDYGKQLKKFEIVEHPFNSIVWKRKKRKDIPMKKKGQIYLWKAVFTFKEIPKDGYLEIWWT